MNRREFLKRTGQAALMAGAALVVPPAVQAGVVLHSSKWDRHPMDLWRQEYGSKVLTRADLDAMPNFLVWLDDGVPGPVSSVFLRSYNPETMTGARQAMLGDDFPERMGLHQFTMQWKQEHPMPPMPPTPPTSSFSSDPVPEQQIRDWVAGEPPTLCRRSLGEIPNNWPKPISPPASSFLGWHHQCYQAWLSHMGEIPVRVLAVSPGTPGLRHRTFGTDLLPILG